MKPPKNNFLLRPRLTLYLPIFFAVTLALIYELPKLELAPAYLTLFIVNTIMLGFCLSPIMAAAKRRTEKLGTQIRQESIVFYKAILVADDLPDDLRLQFKEGTISYLKHKNHSMNVEAGRDDYEALVALCAANKKLAPAQKLLDMLVDNEQNRTQIAMQLRSKVFSHEWLIMFILYAVSMLFLLTLDYGDSGLIKVAAAAIGACLSLTLMIIWKLSTLTHKKAWQIWEPYVRLVSTHFQELD